jgi:hypothetical protein
MYYTGLNIILRDYRIDTGRLAGRLYIGVHTWGAGWAPSMTLAPYGDTREMSMATWCFGEGPVTREFLIPRVASL